VQDVNELEERCRQVLHQSGIDGRTSYFAQLIRRSENIIHRLQDVTRLSPDEIERVLMHFVEDRYADYFERRARGLAIDASPMTFILSQGFKVGLTWRDVPLGKTCWDIAIYLRLIQDLKPRTLIEIGTGLGGSALFFYDTCRAHGLDTKVVTLDGNEKDVTPQLAATTIEFIAGDVAHVADLLTVERLQTLPHPWLIVDDAHVQIPLVVRHLQPLMESGDYLCIEDVGVDEPGSREISAALRDLPKGTFMVDTHYTDMFGRNLTAAPDAIFRHM
jgi:cephalosporin hydroxylase